MNYFERRKQAKAAKELLHHARHARAMREDIAPREDLDALSAAEAEIAAAAPVADALRFEAAAEKLGEAVQRVYPPKNHSAIRENLEILVVAAAVAMGIRTYFVQPFKIPTGSMQPTLYGVKIQDQEKPTWKDRLPFSLFSWAVFGEGYVEVRAKCAGELELGGDTGDGEHRLVRVGGVPHAVRTHMPVLGKTGDFVARGQVIARGRVTIGDHIFVNKVRYNFSRPRRGDIIVFDTTGLENLQHAGDFYIKRLVGLPGERVSVKAPRLFINDRPVEEPFPFQRLLHEPYHGYANMWRLNGPGDFIPLGPDEFLPFGDNTLNSMDGRYFGPVKTDKLVGPAFMIYWPFSERWGRAR